MKITPLFLFLLSISSINAEQTVVVSAGGKLVVFKEADQALSKSQAFEVGVTAGPMSLSPDARFLYVNTKRLAEKEGSKKAKPEPAFTTFSISGTGGLSHIHTAASGWNSGYLRADATGKWLAGNSYRDGKVGIWKVAKDGVYRGQPPVEFTLEKKAHSAVFSPDNRFLFVPATGPNKVFQLVFDDTAGTVLPNQPPSAPGPEDENQARQPRHLVFHPTLNIAFSTNERELPGAGVWRYDPDRGLLKSLQGIVSVEGNTEGMTTADLHLSADGKFLYVSNRDIGNRKSPNKGRDSISLFSIDQKSGKLTWIKNFPCEKIPRSFAIGKAGQLLFVSGQGENKLGVYQIDPVDGHLKKLATHDLPGKPSWVSVF